MKHENTLRQIALPPLSRICAQLNEGNIECAVIQIDNCQFELVKYCEGEEVFKEPHHDIQSAMFAMAQSLVSEYCGAGEQIETVARIEKFFAPSYYIARM